MELNSSNTQMLQGVPLCGDMFILRVTSEIFKFLQEGKVLQKGLIVANY
jgi:hypothetical protein